MWGSSFHFAIEHRSSFIIQLLNCTVKYYQIASHFSRNDETGNRRGKLEYSSRVNRINSERTIRRNHGGRNSREAFCIWIIAFSLRLFANCERLFIIRRPKVVYCSWTGWNTLFFEIRVHEWRVKTWTSIDRGGESWETFFGNFNNRNGKNAISNGDYPGIGNFNLWHLDR